MSVMMLNAMNDSVTLLANIARVCVNSLDKSYHELGKDRDANIKTVTNLYKKGHWSVFEHCQFTYLVTCSRACSLQLARHRHISRTEMSQRYVKFANKLDYAFIFPPGYDADTEEEMSMCFDAAMDDYRRLVNLGMKPEDARFVLPEATRTRMVITLNLRTLLELTEKRANNSGAQWEIRQLVRDMWHDVPKDLKDIFISELKWLQNENFSSV